MNSRQKNIIQILEREGEVTIKALSERLDVSEMTIHRDAEVLEKQRSLYKKRGALVYIENSDRDTTDDYLSENHICDLSAVICAPQKGRRILPLRINLPLVMRFIISLACSN